MGVDDNAVDVVLCCCSCLCLCRGRCCLDVRSAQQERVVAKPATGAVDTATGRKNVTSKDNVKYSIRNSTRVIAVAPNSNRCMLVVVYNVESRLWMTTSSCTEF